MNHYAARQRADDPGKHRWDYTLANKRGGTYPIGYCHAFRPFTPETLRMDQEQCDRWNRDEAPFLTKYHDDGHATAEEACACYRTYLLDHHTRLHDPPEKPDQLHRCAVCDKFTAGAAEVGNSDWWYLCDEHRTHEQVEKLMPAIGECWSSY
jgi:hypothetical protein